MARLVVEVGAEQGREFVLTEVAVIGRLKSVTVPIRDISASREHTRLLKQGSHWFVVDLGSRNGTQVNGKKVDRQKLAPGDRITIGKTTLRFEPDAEAAKPPAPEKEEPEPKETPAVRPPLAASEGRVVALAGSRQALAIAAAILAATIVLALTYWLGGKAFGPMFDKARKPPVQRR